jgi:integrase
MTQMKLTKTNVDKLQDTGKDTSYWCPEVPGFGVRVQPGGRKTYVVRYRTLDGTARKQKLGRCSDFPPEKAREMARRIFAQVAEGKDPRAEHIKARQAPTMAELEERYTREHAVPFKKATSQASDTQNWRLHILPVWAGRKVKSITASDVLKLFGGLSDKRATANQVLALLSKAFNLAETWGYRDRNTNPCHGVKKYEIAEKELILAPAQISRLNATLDAKTADGTLKPDFAAFIRLLMLTGCRKSEIMLAEASWIDLERGLLLLPDSKVGQRRIALSAPALEIARALLADKRQWLIPGRVKGQPLKTPYKVWNAIKASADLPRELRLHDLRHTAGSLAHMAGATQKEIAEMLGHSQLSTTERYLHSLAGTNTRTVGALAGMITASWGKPLEEITE